MWRRRVSEALYRATGAAQVILGTLALVFSASLRASLDRWNEWSPLLGSALEAMQESAWLMLVLLIVSAGALGLLRKHVGPPWVWGLVDNMPSQFREYVFQGLDESEVHYHRVTLFKYVRWRWCWPLRDIFVGWLVPLARSGHTTRTRISRFRAPDDADRAEGIAGKTWAKNGTVVIRDLPDLGAEPSDEEFAAYARATRVGVDWLRQKRPQARSFGGFPIMVKGRPWGVVVLDSRDPNGVVEEDFRVHYRMLARFLGQLLERVD